MSRRLVEVAGLAVCLGIAVAPASASAAGTPTCATTLGISVHGQHIVSDYVAGTHAIVWPPAQQVGSAVGGSGAATPGGPGPGFHFPNGFAPGASFCLSQSSSPGAHPGLG